MVNGAAAKAFEAAWSGPSGIDFIQSYAIEYTSDRISGDDMMNFSAAFPLLLMVSAVPPFPVFAGGKGIYGDDNRLDYYEASAGMRQLADSVVSLWGAEKVIARGQTVRLSVMNFGRANSLAAGERFEKQGAGADCSGALVGTDIVMTAGHCVTDAAACANTRFVFGFAVKADGGAAPTTLPASEVYGCKGIIKREDVEGTGLDYALVRLDRRVSGHEPLAISRNQRLSKGDRIFVIGHPGGLPVKVAGGATIRDVSHPHLVFTDLDTFTGNSGSPVFNAGTGLIEGIQIGGDADFVEAADGLYATSRRGQDEGDGETVTRIAALENLIPPLGAAAKTP